MKKGLSKIKNHPQYAKAVYWTKLISITGSSQAAIQVLGLVCGIVIIRLLPTEEFALYTLANSILGTLTLLSDGGISTGVMAEGGKVWEDKKQLGIVVRTGFELRKKFAIISLVIAMPILAYLLIHHHASYLTAIFIIISIIPNFFAALSDSLLETVLKLHNDIVFLQKNGLIVSISRLIISISSLFFLPFAFIAFIANGIPRVYGNSMLRKRSKTFISEAQAGDKEIRHKIMRLVKNTLPTAIYYSLSGQITIWLISVFGKTSAVADIGALGRITMVLSIFSVVLATLTVPKFAKLSEDKTQLRKFFFVVLGLVAFLSTIAIFFTWLFSKQILYILGPQYAELRYELVLNMIAACVGLLAGTTFTLYSCRGWMINPLISIGADIIAIIAGLFIFDVSSLEGVLCFTILTSGTLFFSNFVFMMYRISKAKKK